MNEAYDLVLQMTSEQASAGPTPYRKFSQLLGWTPSDLVHLPAADNIAAAHLVVEHGLENSAVLSFLRYPRRYGDLSFDEQRILLGISYNNLVDWHISITRDEVLYLYNRTDPPSIVFREAISRPTMDSLRSAKFDQITGKKPNPNIPALDTALIQTLSYWKRELSAASGYTLKNSNLSTLFNHIIFVRAAEDHYRTFNLPFVTTLRTEWALHPNEPIRIVLERLIRSFNEGHLPSYMDADDLLRPFDSLDRSALTYLIEDLYSNKFARLYDYNFSLISKHALSRIYEHYVSLLRLEESDQATLFPRLPEEERNKSYGSFYTPQYIARFFGRFLREHMAPSAFKRIKSLDPACGSGVFLRTLLELQCDPVQESFSQDSVDSAFRNAHGVDVDQNACQATRLSLALLYLVLQDKLPSTLAIVNDEAIGHFTQNPDEIGTYDAIVANPPFVRHELLEPPLRSRLQDYLGEDIMGRADMYLAFVKLAIDLLKPGGIACLVVPQTFLVASNASKLRQKVADECWINCLADLSGIRVFDQAQSYVSLLIFQKHRDGIPTPPATMVRCQELVGQALQDALSGKEVDTPFYSIYSVDQAFFQSERWTVTTSAEARVRRSLSHLKVVGDFLEVRQGFVTGADGVFIRKTAEIPRSERSAYAPYLPDRQISRYTLPKSSESSVFYPYKDSEKLTEQELKTQFPLTWNYLEENRSKLEARSGLARYGREWWEPMWARPPEHMMRPKIVSPNVAVMPKFGIDAEGRYAVTRAPILYPRARELENEYLLFFLAVLNSPVAFWHMHATSSTLGRGYAKLEPSSIKRTPVPDPSTLPHSLLAEILDLVKVRLTLSSERDIYAVERRLDWLVADAYGLTAEDRASLGVGGRHADNQD